MIKFTVYGQPGPMGSKRFVGLSKSGKGLMVESSKAVKPWREADKWAAMQAGAKIPEGPLWVSMVFTLPKPKSAPKRRQTFPATKPDLSKLARSTEDAISDSGLWPDDARVVEYVSLAKRYPGEGVDALDRPGCVVTIWTEDEMWPMRVAAGPTPSTAAPKSASHAAQHPTQSSACQPRHGAAR